jgi:hypothetical protein
VTRRFQSITSQTMKLLRIIAMTAAAALCALGLSVGAAMAEGQSHEPLKGQTAHPRLCLLQDL